MSRVLAVSLLAVGACGFSIDAGTVPDGGSPGDARPDGTLIDAPPSPACPWTYTPEYATPCPAKDGPAIDLATGEYLLDTTIGALDGTTGSVQILSEVVDGARIVWTRGLRIADPATVRVTGTLPLIIISTSSITIDGSLLGNSRAVDAANVHGPGANPAACAGTGMEGARVGQPCGEEGASGGGGGSFGTIGGQGGYGADTRTCTNVIGVPGGAPGITVQRPLTLRGGCPGAAGGQSTRGMAQAGRGSSGGGGIALIARDQLVISGFVNVGGGGGVGARDRSGGGGGGSGGMIVLEGSTVNVIGGNARVTANGGGGGGGCDGMSGGNGEDGRTAVTRADGGSGEGMGTKGGDGSSRTSAAQSANESSRGAGGGGGGLGYIRVHSANGPATSGSNSFSPLPSS